jgi:site-specific recombinase XerC
MRQRQKRLCYTVSGLDDRDILARTAVAPDSLLASVRDAPAGSGQDICTVQELLVHKDVTTTIIYTHVLNRPGIGVKSPLD